MKASEASFAKRDLLVHELLSDVPLHDVWTVDLPGGAPSATLRDVPGFVPDPGGVGVGWATEQLFRLRAWLGRRLGWDRDSSEPDPHSYVHRLREADRARSLMPPGSAGPGPFRVVFELPREALLEVRNATVHAFLSTSLERSEEGYRVWVAIYVKPMSRWTRWYMALIEPLRRLVVYPALIRRMQREWNAARQAARPAGSG